jgi:sugar phosphate isomerase/epimerase
VKLGLYSDSLGALNLPDVLNFCSMKGLTHIELGTGNWSSAPHVDLDALVTSADRRSELAGLLASRNISLSALNCSGNPLHPGEEGQRNRDVTRKTIMLAARIGLDRIVTMSGCPAGPGDRHPNWITTCWPPETTQILEWQWKEHVLPYWRETVAFARDHGVRLAFEMHGNQCVYNVESFERLRDAHGDSVGLNFDPSHMLWMGADPIAVARRVAGSVYHVHAKDTRVEAASRINGRLDAKTVKPVAGRSWNFVAVGLGQDRAFWACLIDELRAGGYDDVMSIENEDYSLGPEDAVSQAIACLAPIVSSAPEPARA